MKRAFGYSLVAFTVIAAGLCGFTWWKLQPHPNPQPLPASLVANDTPEGLALLQNAEAKSDYAALASAFEPQKLASYCGVASSVIALRALGMQVDQSSFFDERTDRVRSEWAVTFGGMTLVDVAGLLEARGANVRKVHASEATVAIFRNAVRENLARENDFIIVNYQRAALGQPKSGHLSPLAAYDATSDRVLVLDTAAHKYPPTWVPVRALFSAMSSVDPDTGRTRGFVEVTLPN